MASLFDAVERPRVIINTNDFNKPKSLADAIEKPIAEVSTDGIPEHHSNKLQSVLDKLLGLHGQERYQLWPEKVVRDAISAPHDVMTGQIPTHEVDPVTGEVHTSSGLIKAAQDVSALAGTGGLAGVGNEAGIALGSGPLKQTMVNTNKPFYSAVENALTAAKQPKADAQQWLSFLKNQPGVKQEELNHLGLDKLSGSITKDDLLKAVQEGQPQIKEVVKGKTSIITKPNPDEPHILEVYHPDDPNGEISGMFGEIVKKDGKFTVNVPEIPRKSFNSQREAEDFISDNSNLGSNTKYHSYQLPGGENYREMLLTLPVQGGTNKRVRIYNSDGTSSVKVATPEELERLRSTGRIKFDELEDVNPQTSYTSSHWDEPNVLAHIRMNDRMIDGKKSLHLEEIQSDWHQEGRKKGYKDNSKSEYEAYAQDLRDRAKAHWEAEAERLNLPKDRAEAIRAKTLPDDLPIHKVAKYMDEEAKLNEMWGKRQDNISAVPDAPFKKTWDELALKKAITHAVKNGYDSISWTPGEAQAARYDLSKSIGEVHYNKSRQALTAYDHNGNAVIAKEATPDELTNIIGKDVAEKLFKDGREDNSKIRGAEDQETYRLKGQDLKVGGQGMKAFYDKMLVDKMNKLISKYDSKVKMVDHNSMKVPTVEITPKLKEKVLKEGFPLFSSGLPIFTPVDHDPFENK